MKNIIARQTLACTITILVLASCLASCTSYFPSKLAATREADTVTVMLTGDGAARWDTEKDSLIVECKDCIPERSIAVVHFEGHNYARFEVARAEDLKLRFYSMGHDTLVNLPGEGTLAAGTSPELLPLPPRDYNGRTYKDVAVERIKVRQPKEPAAPEKPVKKPQSLIVIAPEGVAIYRDKTKKEVLKILPKGSSITLVALEGDMYSVIVDGDEGFVEAEAVEIK
jgi:hypothetical protein